MYIKKYQLVSTDDMDETVVINEIEALTQLYKYHIESNVQPIESHTLEGFSLDTHKLPFANLSTYDSSGLCNAFSLFEKYNYLGKLDQIMVNKEYLETEGIELSLIEAGDLSGYKLSEEQHIRLNGSSILNPSSRQPYTGQEIYRASIDYYDEHTQNLANKVGDEEIGNLINLLNYLQDTLGTDNKEIQQFKLQPCYYYKEGSRRTEIMRGNQNRETGKIDIEGLLGNLKNNVPMILGVWKGSSGHSLLAYKYEKMADDTIKVYVSDSNIPLLEERNWMTESEKSCLNQYNQDVCDNVFVLFKYNQELDKWVYAYNPYLNGNYVYGSGYNFYIPNHYIEVEINK